MAKRTKTIDLNKQLSGLLTALSAQIEALASHASNQAEFDKKIVDDIYATSRALTKVQEFAEIAEKETSSDVNDVSVVRDILNTIEERIDHLARQRAVEIVAKQTTSGDAK